MKPNPVSKEAIWLWGRLKDFERDGLLENDTVAGNLLGEALVVFLGDGTKLFLELVDQGQSGGDLDLQVEEAFGKGLAGVAQHGGRIARTPLSRYMPRNISSLDDTCAARS